MSTPSALSASHLECLTPFETKDQIRHERYQGLHGIAGLSLEKGRPMYQARHVRTNNR
jgi:hypothetical protein